MIDLARLPTEFEEHGLKQTVYFGIATHGNMHDRDNQWLVAFESSEGDNFVVRVEDGVYYMWKRDGTWAMSEPSERMRITDWCPFQISQSDWDRTWRNGWRHIGRSSP